MIRESPRVAPVYELFVLALCVVALGTIVAQHAFRLDPEIEIVLDYADSLICVGLALDFLITLWRAPNRWKSIEWVVFESVPSRGPARKLR